MKFTVNIYHSHQQTGFSFGYLFFFGYQLSPTHHCIPAKLWDWGVLKIYKINELWLQISMCNSWLYDSLQHHNSNICYCSSISCTLKYRLRLFCCFLLQASFLLVQCYFKMQLFSLPFSNQEFCILP